MGSDVKQRVIVFFAVLVFALVMLYPTTYVVGKKLSGSEVSDADMDWKNKWLSSPISLGLDLSGGVHLVYQVMADEAVTGRLETTANSLRRDLRKEKVTVRATVNDENQIELAFISDRSAKKAKEIIEGEQLSGLSFVRRFTDSAGKIVLVYGISEARQQEIRNDSITRAIETLRTRVDRFGVSEPLIQKVGTDRINLQMPGVQDVERVKDTIGKVAKLEFRLLPNSPNDPDTITLKDKDENDVKVKDQVEMGGEMVDGASVGYDPSGKVEVSVAFTPEGARLFGKITGANVGRRLAIILDGKVYSSPEIQERIPGGHCSITGGFDLQEANDLAIVLKAGALPAPLEVLQERTVGPTLGKESIRKGVTAILVGFVLILVFMVVYYKKSGIVASAILLLNVVLVLAGLSAFGATLTLPGLAGLALTVGMAVDANVITFERMREELRNGAGRDAAVSEGFGKALSAIVDANVTTLLAGLVLYYYGTGPIRGFAVTLSIGILTTIYCATFVSRLAFDYFSVTSNNKLSV